MSKLFIKFLIISLILTGSGFNFVEVKAIEKNLEYVQGEFLVKFFNDSEIYKISTTPDADIYETIEKYESLDVVEFIEPNFKVELSAFPNDPDYNLQWYLNTIKIKDAWSKELIVRQEEGLSSKAVIAVLDSGVDLDHPDLESKIWKNKGEIFNNEQDDDGNGFVDDYFGWDFIDSDDDPGPSFGAVFNEQAVKHGTLVAGVAAAVTNNAQGIAGVGWFAEIMPLRVLDSDGSGDVFSVVNAINYAINNGADVINMSFVGSGFSRSLSNAIQNAYNNNIVVVAAAGNTDPGVNGNNLDIEKAYPVCYDTDTENMVIGVASVGHNFVKSNFSNYGNCIDLVAPGEHFWTTQVFEPGREGFSSYYDGFWSGTSLSAPLVSGTAAMIKSLRPGFSAGEIRDFIISNTDSIDTYNPDFAGQLGSGILNVSRTIDSVLSEKAPVVKGSSNSYIVAGLGSGSFPQIKIMTTDGNVFKEFFAYSPSFTGDINVAVGDLEGNGVEEIVTGAGPGGGPHVRVFDINGFVQRQFFAYSSSFRGGVNIAVADVLGDGGDEIITGPGPGEKPEVKIFDNNGNLVSSFLAYSEGFTGGVSVAAGDFNHDGKAEIVTGAGPGGGPHVRIFDSQGNVISQFFAFNEIFRGGVNVTAGDLHTDGQDEIIIAPASKSLPTVKVFTYRGFQIASILAFESDYFGGVNISTKDLDGNGAKDIIVGRSRGFDSLVKAFNINGQVISEFFAHNKYYNGGARTAGITN